MPTNNNDNLIKINGEYVRFYATTNSALPNIMRNTGALIVYQDNSYNSYVRRSLYLSNNFIACGYGVSDEESRNYLEEISYLRNDGSRQLTYELNNIRENIVEVENTFAYYVKIDGGDISNTIIEIPNNGNPIKVTAKEFTRMLVPAEYDDIHITNFVGCVTYEMDSIPARYVRNINLTEPKHYYSYVHIDDDIINRKDKVIDIPFKLPIGSLVTNVKYDFISYNGSTRGFNLTQSDFINNSNYRNMFETEYEHFSKTIILDGDQKASIMDNYGIMSSTNTEFPLPFGEVSTSGTTTYKGYPLLEKETGLCVISYENAILPYTKQLGIFSYIGTGIIKYSLTNDKISNTITIYSDKWEYIDNDSTCIVSDNEYSYLYFAVPTNYDIVSCEIRRKYQRLNNTSYYIYNITGDIYEIDTYNTLNDDSDNPMNNNMYITKNTIVPCRNYYMYYNFREDDTINIKLYNIDKKHPLVSVRSGEYFNVSYIQTELNCSSYFIQDSEFNSNHWFNPSELEYIQRN